MSYLLQFAGRRNGRTLSRCRRAHVDERVRLNRPGYYGDAYVRVLVEDTSDRRKAVEPRIRLRIADCSNTINLEFSLSTAGHRENSLHKVDTLLASLQRFRAGLAAEAELFARRADSRKEDRCPI
jgi:hypothetical protein